MLGYLQDVCNNLYLKIQVRKGKHVKLGLWSKSQWYSNVSGKIEIGNDSICRFTLNHINF